MCYVQKKNPVVSESPLGSVRVPKDLDDMMITFQQFKGEVFIQCPDNDTLWRKQASFIDIIGWIVFGEYIWKKTQNIRRCPKIWIRFQQNFYKSLSNGLKREKEYTKPEIVGFCPSTNLSLENVNTSYHIEFHPILSMNVNYIFASLKLCKCYPTFTTRFFCTLSNDSKRCWSLLYCNY